MSPSNSTPVATFTSLLPNLWLYRARFPS
jgi:hypothetical protein